MSRAPPRGPARPRKRASPSIPGPRGIAIQVLARVEATEAYLNVVLDSVLDEFRPGDPRDAALATELCYGTTRRRLWLDEALAKVSDRRLSTLEDRVLAALRIGAYQLFFMRVPPHAAVGDTVEALKALGSERAAGFVNAILRKLSALPVPFEADSAPSPQGKEDRAHRLSIEHSHPTWLVQRWMTQFGEGRATSMLAADNEPPPVVVRTNTAKLRRDELLAQLAEVGLKARPTTLSPVGIVLTNPGRVEDLYGFAEGFWQVQDEAAQLVTVFAQPPSGARILDVCAAPGGKACHLAESNQVVALDLHANKLRKIATEAGRLGVSHRLTTSQFDARQPLPQSMLGADLVLVDAPCSGLGTLRRHPELRYRRAETDLVELAKLQRVILEQASRAVAPGGLLVYAVCSTDPMEGADQVELFLRSHPDFTSEPPSGLEHLPTEQGYLRTLPGPEGLDGFFAARLRLSA